MIYVLVKNSNLTSYWIDSFYHTNECKLVFEIIEYYRALTKKFYKNHHQRPHTLCSLKSVVEELIGPMKIFRNRTELSKFIENPLICEYEMETAIDTLEESQGLESILKEQAIQAVYDHQEELEEKPWWWEEKQLADRDSARDMNETTRHYSNQNHWIN
ncbi:MAG: hypothetical protein R3321_04915 [Nitrososphaeraceae archaeon]|nr:hypothetical protein [Nitrososphaeraceae archaeon]